MAGSSNPLPDASAPIQDLHYLYASIVNVSNFVSVKLSGNHNYPLWKIQMLCLMKSHDMCGIVDAPNASSIKTMTAKYDSLLKGWIFGSITEDVLVNVFNLDSAKDVWETLNFMYDDRNISFQQAQTKPEAKEETKHKDVVETETETEVKRPNLNRERKTKRKRRGRDAEREEHNSDENTALHRYASIANVCNFVSVKLSGNHNYHLWKEQMLCLMTTHNVCGFVNKSIDRPKDLTPELEKQYDNLVKSWIFGSVSEVVLETVVKLESAQKVWEELKSFFDSTMSSKQEAGTLREEKEMTELKKKLRKATMKGRWAEVKTILEDNKGAEREAINGDGDTILHLAVGIGNDNVFVVDLLRYIKEKGEKGHKGDKREKEEKGEKGDKREKEDKGEKEVQEVLKLINVEGSTALHIAAIVGNLDAAKLLVKKHKGLLTIKNKKGQKPLHNACSNMQFETFMFLYNEDTRDDKTCMQAILGVDNTEIGGETSVSSENTKLGIDLVANAISAKQYSTALKLLDNIPELAFASDNVLMAIARTFPSGLTNGEKLLYPSLGDMRKEIIGRTRWLFLSLALLFFPWAAFDDFDELLVGTACGVYGCIRVIVASIFLILVVVPVAMLVLVYQSIRFLILMVYLPFFLLYFLSWKVATILVPPIKHIEKKKKELEEAKEVLNLVCNKIDEELKSGTHQFNYNNSILEAACQNAYEVVDEILFRSPEAITSTNKNGHDIIQLAVIHRSEKVYNLIYQIGVHKIRYRTKEDCSGNNILHLAARLAPSHELSRRRGAALQLQRELQWHEEVKELVFPTYITRENIFKETPDMVFTREHEKLVKEGERWMKTTAESCSITAALITTIVFAAAITVPGGSNQETGTPFFTKDIAFTIFAISDAMSLFTSSTSLLVFLSILTGRFAEQDFLVSLPRRLIIGLCTLLLSATAMMVAFSATLFLVFCRQKPWMLAPICGLACLPIVFFFAVQFPLIADLLRSTYGRTFRRQTNSHQYRRFNPDDVRGFFGK